MECASCLKAVQFDSYGGIDVLQVHQKGTLNATGEFSLKQSQIATVSVAAGAIRLKEEVKCTFEIVARGGDQKGQ